MRSAYRITPVHNGCGIEGDLVNGQCSNVRVRLPRSTDHTQTALTANKISDSPLIRDEMFVTNLFLIIIREHWNVML